MDITGRKQAEEALRRSEEEFHIIFEHAAIGMVLVDPEGHLLRCNPAFCSIVGYTESDLPSLTFEKISHPEDLDLTRTMYREGSAAIAIDIRSESVMYARMVKSGRPGSPSPLCAPTTLS